ncbi:hypothetical protein KC19_10G091700 [Ceratodon purpureus]|uniref:Uncharacterized protein n=1 Tax=Ceratodon purpureus TaxID=3225 RepID=A0A8T0GL26_CERPU|nr:hypothetical protein KC19_10G091700 [Ceratodon purpureus]
MASELCDQVVAVPKVEHDLNRKNLERIKFAKALHERAKWTVQNFAERLDLEDSGICGKTECGNSHITENHLKRVFPTKGGSGIRVVPNGEISEEECAKVYQQYLVIYNHPPPNKEYARYFLRSSLAEREGKAKINWAKFAYDVCRKQYASWERDGRVEDACRKKWDDLRGVYIPESAGEGNSQGRSRQFGAACEGLRFSSEQTSEVLELLKTAEADNNSIGPKLSSMQ